MAKRVKFMCTAFRDGFQSVFGARVFTKDFLPAVEAARDAGIDWFEAGGGARFQSLYFYCNEDAFAMMDAFRATAGPDADLQTLARGVNVVGLDSQPRDVIKMHAELFKKHGISTIRNFDALNDVDNLIYSGQCIVDAGLKHQVCVTLMELPPGCTGAHDADFYLATLRKILDAGIPYDAVCFKDASGTAVPSKVYETIRRAREMLPEGTFIHYHTHETAGIGVVSNRAALDAGADAIDLSLAPCSGGTCQPDLLVQWHALRGSDYDLGVDVDKIREAEEVFKECMADYFLPPEATAVEPLIPWSPMPGGALTANTQMLRDNGIMEKYSEIIKAMREVVEKGGFGTSVTPVSQFYFQQAFNNVMFGPWKKIAEPYGKMVLGYFGRTPCPPDPAVIDIARAQLGMEPNTRPILEINEEDPDKGLEAARKMLREAGIEDESDETVFIAATCREKGIAFLQGKAEVGVRKIDSQAGAAKAADANASADWTVTIGGRDYHVALEGDRAVVDGVGYEVGVRTADAGARPSPVGPGPVGPGPVGPGPVGPGSAGGTEVKAEMPGKVIRVLAQPGAGIEEGAAVLVLEAMKMEMKVPAPITGTVQSIAVAAGDQVAAGDVLATIA